MAIGLAASTRVITEKGMALQNINTAPDLKENFRTIVVKDLEYCRGRMETSL
jgi:hypothetical protein